MPLPMNEYYTVGSAWRVRLLRQCDLRQVPFIYMPFIKIAADDVFLFKKMSF